MLPPGPWYPALYQTFKFLGDPYGYSELMIAKYGKTMRVRPLNGSGVATTDPECVKQIFAADPSTFVVVPVIAELFGTNAVIATSGTTHRRQRKLLNPRFHGTRMRELFATMHDVTRKTFGRFDALAKSKTETKLVDLTQDVMLEVIIEATFGSDTSLEREPVRVVLKNLIDSLVPSLFGAPFMRKNWSGGWRGFQAARAKFDVLIDEQIAARKKLPTPGDDLFGAFVEAKFDDGQGMESAEIRDQIFTILMAGHETTAVTLAWAIYHLVRNPAVLAKLREELAKVDAGDPQATLANEYLQAVCSETLRLEPPVTDVGRICAKPLTLGQWTIPEGELAFVNVAGLHRDETLYPEAERFRPERFIEKRFSPWEFVPFGGGTRRCLGAAFAEAELGIGIAVFAREWNLESVGEPEVRVRRNITMGPKNGICVRALGRA